MKKIIRWVAIAVIGIISFNLFLALLIGRYLIIDKIYADSDVRSIKSDTLHVVDIRCITDNLPDSLRSFMEIDLDRVNPISDYEVEIRKVYGAAYPHIDVTSREACLAGTNRLTHDDKGPIEDHLPTIYSLCFQPKLGFFCVAEETIVFRQQGKHQSYYSSFSIYVWVFDRWVGTHNGSMMGP